MTNEPIKQRVEVEDGASKPLQEIAQQQQKLAEGSRQAGRATDEQTKAGERQQSTIRRLTSSVQSLVVGWLSFTAVVGVVVSGLRRIGQEAREALDAVRRLADASRDLAATMGGASDELVTEATTIARRHATVSVGLPPENAAELALEGFTAPEVQAAVEREASLPNLDAMGREGGGQTIIHNQTNVGEQYNLSNDGRDRLTEDAPEEMD